MSDRSDRDIEQILRELPKVSLAPERDARIRQVILSAQRPEGSVPSRRFALLPRFSFAIAGALVMVIGMSGYAYASPSVTRGGVLYPMKRAIERVHGSWQRTPLQRVRYHSDLALRRAAELGELLRERGRYTALSLLPVAHAATAATAADAADPVTATAAEVIQEANAAARAAEAIRDPRVAKRATEVLLIRQARVAERLRVAAGATGITNTQAVDAVAQAIEGIREVARATEAAVAEVEVAVQRGEREIVVTIVIPPRGEPEDVGEITEDLIEEGEQLADLRAELAAVDVPVEDVARFTDRIAAKLASAEVAIREREFEQAHGLLKAAEALRKNAKHFLKIAERVAEEVGEQLKEEAERAEESVEHELERQEEAAEREVEAAEEAGERERAEAEGEAERREEQREREQERERGVRERAVEALERAVGREGPEEDEDVEQRRGPEGPSERDVGGGAGTRAQPAGGAAGSRGPRRGE